MTNKDIPTLYTLNKRIKNLNSKWKICQTPGELAGVQVSFKQSLTEQILQLQANGFGDNTVKVKISGDGTNIGKRLKIFNFTYTILNEKGRAMGEKGNYVLAIVKTQEKYENLRDSLLELKNEMSSSQDIMVNNQKYNIEYFLGGDWKFLACVCGLGPANQDFACMQCQCPRIQKGETAKVWSITDESKGARSLRDIEQYAKSKQFNCKAKPLFDFIPLDHVIIFNLFLRISDNLIDLLIRELRLQDAIEKSSFSKGLVKGKYKYMDKYELLLNEMGINFHWSVSKETKKLEQRDLTGPEKLVLFKNINIVTLQPTFLHNQELQLVWDDFIKIIYDLKKHFTSDEVKVLQSEITAWFQRFLKMYQTKDITPYMHALHIPMSHSFLSYIQY